MCLMHLFHKGIFADIFLCSVLCMGRNSLILTSNGCSAQLPLPMHLQEVLHLWHESHMHYGILYLRAIKFSHSTCDLNAGVLLLNFLS